MLFATDLLHSSYGVSDVDSNQLITPEFTVTETGSYLVLYLHHKESFSLNIYNLNELNHRLPNSLHSTEVWDEDEDVTVSYSCNWLLQSVLEFITHDSNIRRSKILRSAVQPFRLDLHGVDLYV